MALGPKADRPLNLWQESFVPMALSGALRGVVVRDAHGDVRPLVNDEQVVLPGRLPPAPAEPSELGLPFLICGLGLAALLLGLARRESRLRVVCFGLLAGAWWVLCGLSGFVLIGLWQLTDHWAASMNENLLLLDPVCLILPLVWWSAPRIARYLLTSIAVAALVSPVVRMLPGLYQGNLPFIALAIPVHLSLALLSWRRRLVAGAAVQRIHPSPERQRAY